MLFPRTLLSAGLIFFGVVSFAAIGSTKLQGSAQSPPPSSDFPHPNSEVRGPRSEVQPSPQPNRLTVKLSLTHPQDLKVKVGDRLSPGQVIADRSTDRDQLLAKQQQLDLSIQQLATPLAPIGAPPTPDFSAEEAAIAATRTELALLQKAPVPQYRFIDPAMDPVVTQQRFEVKAAQVRAAANLNQAIANLERARHTHQQRLYEHSLNLQRQQADQRRQQYDVAQLVAQRETVASQLQEISAVRSPYSGTVRRVRVLGQSERVMDVEVVMEVKAQAQMENPGSGAEWSGGADEVAIPKDSGVQWEEGMSY